MPTPPDNLLTFNGVNGATGEYSLPPMTGTELGRFLLGEAKPDNLNELRNRRQGVSRHFGVEGVDPRRLDEAGWGVIFTNDADPAVREALAPLLALRREQAGDIFKVYGYQSGETKAMFLARHGVGPGPPDPRRAPYYLLVVGSPEAIPYRFQSQLDVQYAVGRLYFNCAEDYAHYAASVVAAEMGQVRLPRRMSFFGVQNTGDAPTRLSTQSLVTPLFEALRRKWPDWQVDAVLRDEATKTNLARLLGGGETPALLFTSSHGMGFPLGDPRQRPHQGALLCHDWPGPDGWNGRIPQDFYFAGDDLASDADLFGLVTFHFACYSAGTPLLDDFPQRAFKDRVPIAPEAFLAALPTSLLGHARGGALAVVGHVERAWGYSFYWRGAGAQTAVFESALTRLLDGYPVGFAMDYLNARYAELSTMLADQFEDINFGAEADAYELAGLWTANNDARGYAVLGDPAVRLPVFASNSAGLGTKFDIEPGATFVEGLKQRLRDFQWDNKSRETPSETEIQWAVRSGARRSEEAPLRFLQLQLCEYLEPFQLERVQAALRPLASYRASIRVGLPDREWANTAEPFPTPAELPEERGHRLSVVFWEPRVSPEPQVETLWLPPEGSSEPCAFFFLVPGDVEMVAARITVLHRNRVLQTGILRAPVGGAEKWSFGIDAAPRARLEGLSSRSRFDVALVLNHDGDGIPRLTAVSDDRAAVITVGEDSLEALTKILGDQISNIAADPDRYATLMSDGTEELLRNLAQIGGQAHERLCKHTFLEEVLADKPCQQPRIHITSAKVDSFLPIELLYRFEAPEETAKVCGHAAAALAAAKCPAECPSDKSQTVCPLGFWGMCRVIERHAHHPEHTRIQGGFELRPEPFHERSLLGVAGKSLLAASDKASEVNKDAVAVLLDQLRKRGPAERVNTWKDWEAHIDTDGPTLLVLLPHHKRQPGFEILEIGTSDPLKSALVKEKHVRIQRANRTTPVPIVLLMGCETNVARVAFDNFATSFLDNGAAVVVSTIATILGRHASPATAKLVELLDELAKQGDHTFGEVMLRLRRSLVASETPMALCLTAYGDADWLLTNGG